MARLKAFLLKILGYCAMDPRVCQKTATSFVDWLVNLLRRSP